MVSVLLAIFKQSILCSQCYSTISGILYFVKLYYSCCCRFLRGACNTAWQAWAAWGGFGYLRAYTSWQ